MAFKKMVNVRLIMLQIGTLSLEFFYYYIFCFQMGPNSHIVYQSGLHRVSCKKNHCRNPRPLTYYTQPKTLLLRRTGKERPFPHSERIWERPLPIKMMNGKENAVQFFVNERERSGALFFRERIRPCYT